MSLCFFSKHTCFVLKQTASHGLVLFMLNLLGWGLLMEVFHVFTGSVQTCAQVVREGHLVAIAPGGVLEAQFSDENYNLLWGRRTGFAKVALQTQCPVIPVFTKNVREAFRSISVGRSLLRKLYDKTRIPVVPIYGGFPVRLRTYIGKPVSYDENTSPEELVEKTAEAVRNLIYQHQKLPGNILRALMERVYEPKKEKLKKA
ncbi:transmembrane protein 68-like [Limulus polyphemus]|uniref:Transmembrane protein 68-like n=1 Tax=Limulus polyphemus TaxID=6850 RepID=A0ABM1BUN3_LIMPO|nr:transmembrane protein 68-like [Limulus polyphemus]